MASDPEGAVSELPDYNPEWTSVLTGGHGSTRLIRGAMRRIPSEPRCKVCSSPFAGPGKALRVLGFKPSRKNPNFCGRCIEAMPRGGAEVDVGVLFADLRGSTALAEQLGPQEFARLLHRFYHAATVALLANDAIIDKLIGDEVMALFIPGFTGGKHRERTIDAGIALLKAIAASAGTGPAIPVGVGVHAGTAFVGNVGSGVVDFTALGDTVNTTARLQGFAAAGEIVISEELYASASPALGWSDRRDLTLRGKAEPVAVRVARI